MNILLVDNGTIHINELKDFVNNHKVTLIKKEDLTSIETAAYDLIILSGSSESPIVTSPEKYRQEIELIKTCEVPIVGICMGFEIIAYAYGATLKELPEKEHGLIEIIATTDDYIFSHSKKFTVAENHRWVVTKIKNPLVELAISKDGIEALKHTSKLIYGFQFHPEIGKENNLGSQLFKNLLEYIDSSKKNVVSA